MWAGLYGVGASNMAPQLTHLHLRSRADRHGCARHGWWSATRWTRLRENKKTEEHDRHPAQVFCLLIPWPFFPETDRVPRQDLFVEWRRILRRTRVRRQPPKNEWYTTLVSDLDYIHTSYHICLICGSPCSISWDFFRKNTPDTLYGVLLMVRASRHPSPV